MLSDFTDGEFIEAADINPVCFDTGDFKASGRRFAASGWLLCDGSAVSRATYATLFDTLVPDMGAVTVTLASPGVFTLTAHGLVVGDKVYLETTGALPTGLAVDTIYYVVSVPTSSTFTVSATRGGSAINTSGSQSGTHSLYFCPYGLGDGSTTFNVPDALGRSLVTAGGSNVGSLVAALGQNDGVAAAYRQGTRHQHTKHVHTLGVESGTAPNANSDAGDTNYQGTSAGDVNVNTNSVDGGSGVTTDPTDGGAYIVVNLFIKT